MKRVLSSIQSRVSRRIFVLFVLCALLPVCVLALLSLQRISARLEDDSHERLRQVAKNAGMTILKGLAMLQDELESMPLPTGDDSRNYSRPSPTPVRDKRFRTVTVIKNSAAVAAVPGMLGGLTAAAHAHLDAGNALIIAGTETVAGDRLYLATSTNRNLRRQDILVGEINPEYLWTLVGYTLPPGIDICILGPSGKTLYSSLPLTSALVSRIMSGQDEASIGQFNWQRGEEDFLVNYWSAYMKPAYLSDSWAVVAVQSRQYSLGPARPFVTTFLLVIFLTLFVVVFVSSVLIRRSLVPLSILNEGARRLSCGDFDSRVAIASGDEFEELAVSFNDMSAQLGNQFYSLNEMGTLVRMILAAHDRGTIIDAVMSRFRNSVPCEWLGISLADENPAPHFMASYYNCSKGVKGDTTETVRFATVLSGGELESLRITADNLHVKGAQGFAPLLGPLVSEGGEEFFLLPIFIQDRFLGTLMLGYRCIPERIREELVRSRQVADEIAVALDNVRLIDELSWLNRGTIEVLANAVDAKSPWTAGHSKRVTTLALDIGKGMGLSRGDLELLQWGGLFHDIGKIGVSEYILDKPGKLTEEEYAVIKKHPEKGAEMLMPIRAYHGAIPLVAQHHEQFDGQGYPLGLAGDEIALGARILAVADVFDALYSNRPYRQGWEIGRVISYMMEKAGSDFDPEVINAFLKIDLTAAYFESSDDAGR